MFWWTTLLYTVPVTEKELLAQCDVVLVYMRDGVFGKLEMIRGPAHKRDTGVNWHETMAPTLESDRYKSQDSNATQSNTKTTTVNQPPTAGITWSTPEEETMGNDMLVTTGNPADPEVTGNDIPAQQPSASSSLATVDVIIPESADDIKPGKDYDQEQERSKPLLPSIGVFLSKTCTIPLIRCDFEQIKKKQWNYNAHNQTSCSKVVIKWNPRLPVSLQKLIRKLHALKLIKPNPEPLHDQEL